MAHNHIQYKQTQKKGTCICICHAQDLKGIGFAYVIFLLHRQCFCTKLLSQNTNVHPSQNWRVRLYKYYSESESSEICTALVPSPYCSAHPAGGLDEDDAISCRAREFARVRGLSDGETASLLVGLGPPSSHCITSGPTRFSMALMA